MRMRSSNRLPAPYEDQPVGQEIAAWRHDAPTKSLPSASEVVSSGSYRELWDRDADADGEGTADDGTAVTSITPSLWLGPKRTGLAHAGSTDGSTAGDGPTARQRPPRQHISRKRTVPAVLAWLLILVAGVVAVGPAHLFVQAAPNLTIYGDSLAPGWQNESYQSWTDLANRTSVYDGTHSIAWRANQGWSTLYLRSSQSVTLQSYSSLTFAMRASQPGQHYGVKLLFGHGQSATSLQSLAPYGGDPVTGSWTMYTIPLAVLAPSITAITGVELQAWSSSAQPIVYVDSIMLRGGVVTSPTVPAPSTTVTPSATATAVLPPPPTGGTYPSLPLTTANIHVALPFNYNVADPSSESGLVDYVWGSRYATQPAGTYNTYYYPFEREPSNGHTLTWFQTNHPDWIEYKCDRTTPAYEYGDPDVPLDIANPIVLDYIWSTYLQPHLAAGYNGLAFDNVHLQNWVGRCGHYDRSGAWVQQYSGTRYESTYENTVMQWAQYMYAHVHTSVPADTVSMNFTYDSNVQALSYQLYQYMDIDVDESGFTYMPSAGWLQDMQAYQKLMSMGHGLVPLNQEPQSFGSITTGEKQWCLANYLLIKNQYTYIFIAGSQQYGSLLLLPEYSAQIGSPTNAMYASQNVYMRDFTNGLALVNPSSSSSYTVTVSGTYRDLYGNAAGNTVTLASHSGLVLLKG